MNLIVIIKDNFLLKKKFEELKTRKTTYIRMVSSS